MVPPRHYCVILNPVARDTEGQVLFDQSGQAKLRHADLEIRLTQDPFPLYPGEEIQQVCLHLQGRGWTQVPVGFVTFQRVCVLVSGRDPAPDCVSGHGAASPGAAGLPGRG